MKIIPAQLEDMPEILQLQLCYLSEAKIYNVYNIPPLTQTLEEIERDFTHHFFLKAVINNKIVGSVRAYQKSETCYIGSILTIRSWYRDFKVMKKPGVREVVKKLVVNVKPRAGLRRSMNNVDGKIRRTYK